MVDISALEFFLFSITAAKNVECDVPACREGATGIQQCQGGLSQEKRGKECVCSGGCQPQQLVTPAGNGTPHLVCMEETLDCRFNIPT